MGTTTMTRMARCTKKVQQSHLYLGHKQWQSSYTIRPIQIQRNSCQYCKATQEPMAGKATEPKGELTTATFLNQ